MVSDNKKLKSDRPKVVAVVQARMGSTRLPGKVMMPLAGVPAVKRVMERVASAHRVDEVVLATTLEDRDYELVKMCRDNGWQCFRGSEDNVLMRVYTAAQCFSADVIVDITGDCPLVDPRHIDVIVDMLLKGMKKDSHIVYASNIEPRSWPDGLDIQAYKTETLRYGIERMGVDRRIKIEHAGWNITNYTKQGQRLSYVALPRFCYPDMGLTLDTPEDYKLLSIIFDAMEKRFRGRHDFPVISAIDYVLEHPELLEINAKVKRKVPGDG